MTPSMPSGRDIVDGEFTFEVRELNGNAVLNGSNRSNKVVFDGKLQFNGVGTYHYNVVETSGDKNGVVSDKTVYLVTVNVTDANGILSASYVVVNAVGDTITFKNTYKASPAEHTIKGNKTLRGRTLLNDEFTFALTELAVDGKAVAAPQTLYAKNFVNLDLNVVFPTITYTKAGTYEYSVKEINTESGAAYGINYDKTEYKVTVVVKDDGKGVLYIASERISLINNTPASSLSFVNDYQPKGTSAQFVGDKQLIGRVDNALSGGEFEFELYLADSEWQKLELLETVKNQKDGIIIFSAVDFETEEDGYFIITEKNAGQTINGITYDDAVYHVWVDVTDDLKGQLHATVHVYDENGIPQAGIDFLNIYEVTGGDSITLSGEKQLIGRDFTAEDEFSFELYETDATYTANGEAKLVSAMDKQTKRYSFGITYTADDAGKTFYYLVKEANAGKTVNGITYSDAEYRIAVSVTDNGNGGIDALVEAETDLNALDFTNVYASSSVSIGFAGNKILNGRELKEGEFSFLLYNANESFELIGEAIESAVNKTDGGFEFSQIEFTESGIYRFVITENAENALSGVEYDNSRYLIAVSVADNGNGALEITETVMQKSANGESEAVNAIEFVNTYNAKHTGVSLGGNKVLVGRELEEGEFSFLLYNANGNFEIDDSIEALIARNGANGEFAFEAVEFTSAGIYRFVIVEDKSAAVERVSFDETVYLVQVEVIDDGNGSLVCLEPTVVKSGSEESADEIVFTNVYTPKPENLTVDVNINKTVINKGSAIILPEGFEFLLSDANGDGEGISATSDSNGMAQITLSFSEADIGKVFSYKLKEVNSGKANVTYSEAVYEITVEVSLDEESNKLVADLTVNGVETDVIATAFENIYDYTPTPPPTGDNGNMFLWMIMMVISGGAAITLFATSKKKRASARM